jgi:hypothetical protein
MIKNLRNYNRKGRLPEHPEKKSCFPNTCSMVPQFNLSAEIVSRNFMTSCLHEKKMKQPVNGAVTASYDRRKRMKICSMI